MVRYALGRCRICARKHKLPIYGSRENQHVLIEKIHLELIVLNTVCMDCIEKFEKFVKESETAGSGKNFEFQGETPERDRTSDDIIFTDGCTETWQKMHYYVESSEETRHTECSNGSTHESEENFIGIEKTIERLTEKQESTLDVNTPAVVKDQGSKRLRMVGATRAAGGTMSCDFCSKQFTHRGDLKRHKRKHTGERPYECPDCLKTFSQLSNLSRHRLVHSGERPFSCKQCGQSYSRKGRLASHMDRDLCQRKKKNKKINTTDHRSFAINNL